MLRQVFILKKDDVIYKRIFGNALSNSEIENLSFKIRQEAMKKLGKAIGYYDYFKYRIAYDVEIEIDLIFIFVTGLMDDFFRLIQTELINFKTEFLKLFNKHIEKKKIDSTKLDVLNPIIDSMHRNLKPKIAVVGFSGVGKTTIKKLIKLDEIPLQHIPTISGDIATIKIGKLEFRLFDFAGQEQFKYLWKGFIKGSNAVLIITDSTLNNVEKSRFFLKLINNEASYARSAIIGNKQDLRNAMKVDEIENLLGLKTFPMVANRAENRDKMIRIIADILDMSIESSPLLGEIFEKEDLIEVFKSTEGKSLSEQINISSDNNTTLKLSESSQTDISGLIIDDTSPLVNSTLKQDPIDINEGQKTIELDAKKELLFQSGISEYKLNRILKRKKEKSSKLIQNNLNDISLVIDLCNEVANDIKDIKVDDPLKTHFKMISTTLKSLNNNEDYTFEDFYKNYQNYMKNEFLCYNSALKQFLEPQFALLKKNIEKDEIIASNLHEDISFILNALNCAYLTTSNPKKFPNFGALLKKFKLYIFNSQELNSIRAYYIKFLEKFKE